MFVPGGCGYVGAMLVPSLLADGHEVTVLDPHWFGSGYLPEDNVNLKVVKGDIRDHVSYGDACKDADAVIFLASLSNNDLCKEMPEVALNVNERSFKHCVKAARDAGVRRFIYASSVAVYGSTDEDAREDHPLNPTTPYAVAKAHCEQTLLGHSDTAWTVIVTRSASVCGYSPRPRFDLTVNKMVNDAIRRHRIVVNGGRQKRCHIHMSDLISAYQTLLVTPPPFADGQVFNLVAENLSLGDTAQIVSEETGADIKFAPRTDDRSYTCDGSKAKAMLGFKPTKDVRYGVRELKRRFDAGDWPDSMENCVYQNMVNGIA